MGADVADAAGTEERTADSKPGRRRTLRRVGCGCLAVLLLFIALVCAYVYDLFPPVKPSASEKARVTQMLRDYAESQWGGRVEVEKVDVQLELQGSDTPPHDWKEYTYHAYFRIKGTDVAFFASLPLGTQREDVGNWWEMNSKLDSDEVALLKAYSRQTSVPAGGWGSDAEWGSYAEEHPGSEVWTVEPIALGEMFSSSMDEYVFEKQKDGSFKLLERP